MTNRKKRAQKSILTLQSQKEKHLQKREEAYKQKKTELVHYFDKELTNMNNQIAEREDILEK